MTGGIYIEKGAEQIGGVKNVQDVNEFNLTIAEFVKKKYDVYFCNSFILMDTPSGDGIEVMVSLEEQEMGAFQLNEELMPFVSIPLRVLESLA
ncbi:hypothetical protein LguiA_022266 [Lonicera macranthoides]